MIKSFFSGILCFLCFLSNPLVAQDSGKQISTAFNGNQETIALHPSNTFFLVGEYLYYSIFCLNGKQDNLSGLSKIAYVELLSEDGKKIFKQKVNLVDGRGQGDFFIPSDTPSGSYKLIAYSQAMLFHDNSNYYESDIVILNPYTSKQDTFRKLDNGMEATDAKEGESSETRNETILGLLTKSSFSTREAITINLGNLNDYKGTYAISIHKKMPFKTPARINFKNNTSSAERKKATNIATFSIAHLPEIRGELITAHVVDRDSGDDAKKLRLGVSIPGKKPIFKIQETDSQGYLSITLDQPYDGEELIIQPIETNRNIAIALMPKKEVDMTGLDFYDFYLEEQMEPSIKERSIQNQIENNYYYLRPDSLIVGNPVPFFYGNEAERYVLDEYKRFRTVAETIVEVLSDVSVRGSNDTKYVRIRPKDFKEELDGIPPLILIDGLMIKDHSDLLEFKPENIKSIDVVRDRYILGTQIFQGILNVATFDGDYLESADIPLSHRFKLFKPLPKKNYYQQDYNENYESSKIPDFRHQLLWNPNMIIDENTKEISFYTSDVKGVFEISIVGFLNSGEKISVVQEIIVD